MSSAYKEDVQSFFGVQKDIACMYILDILVCLHFKKIINFINFVNSKSSLRASGETHARQRRVRLTGSKGLGTPLRLRSSEGLEAPLRLRISEGRGPLSQRKKKQGHANTV